MSEEILWDLRASDHASGPIRRVASSLDELSDEARAAAYADELWGSTLRDVNEDLGDSSRASARAERAIRRLGRQAVQTSARLRILDRSVRRLNRTSNASGGAGRGAGGASGGGGRGGGGVAAGVLKSRAVLMGVGLSALASVIPSVVAAVSALSAAAAGLVGALAPVTGVLVAYPGYLAAFAQAFLAGKLALAGFSDGVQALGDRSKSLNEVNQALAKFNTLSLTRDVGKQFLNTARQVATSFTYMQVGVKQALLPALTSLGSAVQSLMPTLSTGMAATGKALATAASGVAQFVRSAEAQRLVGRIMASNVSIVSTFSSTAVPALHAVLAVLSSAGPMLNEMAMRMSQFANSISRAAIASAAGGGMSAFFAESLRVLRQLARIAMNFGRGLFTVFKAGAPLGRALLASFEGISQSFASFIENANKTGKLRDWFVQMTPVVYELGYLVRDIGKALLSVSGDGTGLIELSQMLRNDLLPVITKFVQTTGQNMLPVVLKLFSAVISIVNALSHFGGLVFGLNAIATVLAVIAKGFEFLVNILGPFSKVIALIFGTLIAGRIVVYALNFALKALQTGFLGTAVAARTAGIAIKGMWASTGIGLVVVAISLIAEAIMAMTAATDEATAANKEYAQSLFDVNGKLVDNYKEIVANKLAQNGMLDSANALGIGGKELIDAVTNQGDAYANLKKRLEDTVKAGTKTTRTGRFVVTTQTEEAKSAKALLDQITGMNQAVAEEGRLAALASAAAGDLGESNKLVAQATKDAAAATERLNSALQRLKGLLSDRASRRQYLNDLQSLKDSIKENGANFDIMTQKGRQNLEAMDSIFSTQLDRINAAIEAGNKPKAMRLADSLLADLDKVRKTLGPAAASSWDAAIKPLLDELSIAKGQLNSLTESEWIIKWGWAPNAAPGSSSPWATTGSSAAGGIAPVAGGAGWRSTGSSAAAGIAVPTPTAAAAQPGVNIPGLTQAAVETSTLVSNLNEVNGKSYTSYIDIVTRIKGKNKPLPTAAWSGGPVIPGLDYMVGEMGPEVFVSRSGRVSMVGVNGPEVRSFGSGGYILPNNALPDDNDRQLAVAGAIASRSSGGSGSGGGGSTSITSTNSFTINAQTEFDVVRAVKRGIREAERERRERR